MTKFKEVISFIALGVITVCLVISGLAMLAYSATLMLFMFIVFTTLSALGSICSVIIIYSHKFYLKVFKKE